MRYSLIIVASGLFLLANCQYHVPPLETSPEVPGPTIHQITNHLSCTLAEIVNYSPDERKSYDQDAKSRLDERIRNLSKTEADSLKELLTYLTTDNFVVAAQLSLEVTDNEGLNPSFSFVTPYDGAIEASRRLGQASGADHLCE